MEKSYQLDLNFTKRTTRLSTENWISSVDNFISQFQFFNGHIRKLRSNQSKKDKIVR